MKPHFYIFLDVDGVLHPARWGVPGITDEQAGAMSPGEYELQAALRGFRATIDGLPFSKLPFFEEGVRPHLDHIEIVITSSWRTKPELYDAILEAMSPDVRTRVAGPTPKDYGRPMEINRWLHEHGKQDAMAIVLDDDESHEWRRLTKRAMVLLTETEKGFVEEDGQCLASLLSLDSLVFADLVNALPVMCRRDRVMEWIAERK